ncbi:hypothetical protein Sjap_017076 [Stephania japonica]|uniref:Uncharacterized protein n=1 Tax=Stephania japonica TaxID=461633 RepID=A0AAP0NLL1_9MAGN
MGVEYDRATGSKFTSYVAGSHPFVSECSGEVVWPDEERGGGGPSSSTKPGKEKIGDYL